MRKLRFFFVFILLAPVLIFSTAPNQPPRHDPFHELETRVRGDIDRLLSTWPAIKTTEDKERTIAILTHLYQILHDIRNHGTFGELWENLKWEKNHVRILYVASGSHLAPLEFLHRSPSLTHMELTYTEVDPNILPRFENLLNLMVRSGYYSELSLELSPEEDPAIWQAWNKALMDDSEGLISRDWNRFVAFLIQCSESFHREPGFNALYRFRYGKAEVHLTVRMSLKDDQMGSTSYYRQKDFSSADLILTHDWSHDPRENLAALRDFILSMCVHSAEPTYVMMEDLESFPFFPVDMEIFNPISRAGPAFGHRAYNYLPDGSRLDTEDGEPLFTRGVLLKPDTGFFCGLEKKQLDSLFDLYLFRSSLLGRGNVDIVDGKPVRAPVLLDFHTGYGYRDIQGNLIEHPEVFFVSMLKDIFGICSSTSSDRIQKLLKKDLDRFRITLENFHRQDPGEIFQDPSELSPNHPFLMGEESRKTFQKALKERNSFIQARHREKEMAGTLIQIIEEYSRTEQNNP